MSLGISSAGNTYNPCLLVLKENGYRLSVESTTQGSLWCAEKDGAGFMGDSPAELLGLVTLWEKFGEAWNRQTPDILGELLERND